MTGSARSSSDDRPAQVRLNWRAHFWRQLTAILVTWLILGLFLFDGTVIIDENKFILVFRIGITLCTFVARTEVA